MPEPYAAAISHRMLGPIIRLTVADGYDFVLTFQEAQILSKALRAVKDKKSPVDEVYMSPIANDYDFVAKVLDDGVIFEAKVPPLKLDWSEVGRMSEDLAKAAPENPVEA